MELLHGAVTDFCARISDHFLFSVFAALLVLSNAAWIVYSLDKQNWETVAENARSMASVDLMDSTIASPFIIDGAGGTAIDIFFIVGFLLDFVCRFGALQDKRQFLGTNWLMLDALVLVAMIVDFMLERLSGAAGTSVLGVFRIFRIVRVVRFTMVLRYFPEVVQLVDGMIGSFRAMCVAILLIAVVVFVFGIGFSFAFVLDNGLQDMVMVGIDVAPGVVRSYRFDSVGGCMWHLLIDGLFMSGFGTILEDMRTSSVSLAVFLLFFLFVFTGALVLLNMIIGFQCDIAARVSESNRETNEVFFLVNRLTGILEGYDKQHDKKLSRDDFQVLLSDPELAICLDDFGTDISSLSVLAEQLFSEEQERMRISNEAYLTATRPDLSELEETRTVDSDCDGRLTFVEILQLALQLRGTNGATVTDVTSLREYMRNRMDRLEKVLAKLVGRERVSNTKIPPRPSTVSSESSFGSLPKVQEHREDVLPKLHDLHTSLRTIQGEMLELTHLVCPDADATVDV